MGESLREAVLAEEQSGVDDAYRWYERQRQETEALSSGPAGGNSKDYHAVQKAWEARRSADELDGQPLVIMRVVQEGVPDLPQSLYLGRRTVYDDDRDLVVVKWTNPEATQWRLADQQKPGPVRLRRTLKCEKRRVVGFVDELQVGQVSAPGVSAAPSAVPTPAQVFPRQRPESQSPADEVLLKELDRVRDGRMHDIVETVRREQLRLMADRRPGTLIVQGGPGAGKTAVGLHRVTWLLDNERFKAGDVLVVGPHRGFLEYVGQVLPVLGTRDVTPVELAWLWEGEIRGTDAPDARRIKADLRMAEVLRRAVENAIRPLPRPKPVTAPDGTESVAPVRVVASGVAALFSWEEFDALLARCRDGRGSYRDRRQRLVDALVDRLLSAHAKRHPRGGGDDGLRTRMASSASIQKLLNEVWPAINDKALLRGLLAEERVLAEAADGLLDGEEQRLLLRPAARRQADEPWTADDLVLLEELRHLISGEDGRRYGHVVIDEAQDLTPMQARALARRCPSGSMTVLGDLAQGTGPYPYRSWRELGDILSGTAPLHHAELLIGYRLPREVMDFAAPLAMTVAPETAFPRAVRPPGRPVRTIATTPWKLLDEVAERVEALTAADGGTPRSVAVIVPAQAAWREEVPGRIDEALAGDGATGRIVTVLSADEAKGLEFDHVIVLEPEAIAESGPSGLRQLYVALTRCTQSLTVVHAGPLPPELVPARPSPGRPGHKAAPRQCSRYHADGTRCTHRTREPDGWCRWDGCGGFRTSDPRSPVGGRSLPPLPRSATSNTRLSLTEGELEGVTVTAAALRGFLQEHGGTGAEAAVELHAMLREFLTDAEHAQQYDGYWLLDQHGYRLVLSPDADAVTAYRTVHAERSYAQHAAGVPSRISRLPRRPPSGDLSPGERLTSSEVMRRLTSGTIGIHGQAADRFERLHPETEGLGEGEFDTRMRHALAADAQGGRLVETEHSRLLLGERVVWGISPDGRVVRFVRSRRETDGGRPEKDARPAERPGVLSSEPSGARGGEKTAVTMSMPDETEGTGDMLGQTTADMEATVRRRTLVDRACKVHETTRHHFVGELYEAGRRPVYDSPFADILCELPTGKALYEVLGEGGHRYQEMRQGVLRLLEAEYCSVGKERVEECFLVLPRHPEEEWAAEAIRSVFGVSVLWRTEHGWGGPGLDRALGEAAGGSGADGDRAGETGAED